ncbi:hypothetical protein BDK51DRAFT_25808 [Blyttiomyces helicus]|uniref:Uncharacterized protein n=1 Tax=Blyttiomyces helicus TaxID=388810 RepID=A0A4P9WGE9_9FUNG|nr:hypothetical protein BDK51DRAFT_25808 [Blyttiomyces helicus]|eukprot:RKO90893.1 hypothetical protein BDK51DRAFT_25808 [Blyttiomyces helicus]
MERITAWAESVPANASDADNAISEHLVEVRSLEDLQSQNAKLIRALRAQSARMRDLEAQRAADHNSAQRKLQERLKTLQDQLTSQIARAASFERERDTWRRLAEKSTAAGGGGAGSSSSPGGRPATPVGGSRDGLDWEWRYKETQRDFDNYRKESGQDTRTLKDELEKLRRDKTTLEVRAATLDSQLRMQGERYTMLNTRTESLEGENGHLRERIATITTNYTALDAKVQDLSNAILEERTDTEKLRKENQCLIVERDVEKGIVARSRQESQSLLRERNQAHERLASLQRLLTDKEASFSASITRFESKLEALERELTLSRRQAHDALEESRATTARTAAEARAASARIEKLAAERARALAECDAGKSRAAELAARVEELVGKLAVAEARLDSEAAAQEGGEEGARAKVRELEIAIAAAKRDTTAAKHDLASAREAEENYRQIAQEAEKRLEALQALHDALRSDLENQVAERTSVVEALERERADLNDRLESVLGDLVQSQEKSDNERREHERTVRDLEQQLETAIKSEELAVAARELLAGDVQTLVGVAEEAKTNYNREHVAHSKALEEILQEKKKLADARQELGAAKQRAELAEANAATQQASWDTTRQSLNQEISELKSRLEDLTTQNGLLFDQFEQYQKSSDTFDTSVAGEADRSIGELRELVRSLRGDKVIIETRLEIALQENDRIKGDYDYVQRSLDETRTILDEERKRTNEAQANNRRHDELIAAVNDLNVLRESNHMLREELKKTEAKLTKAQEIVASLRAMIDPLKEEVATLKAEVEVRKEENNVLIADNTRWKARAQQILDKYERVDPAEHAKLKDDTIKMQEEITALQAKVIELETANAASQEASKNELDAAKSDLETAKSVIEKTKSELETAIAKRNEMVQRSNAFYLKQKAKRQELDALQAELQAERASLTEARNAPAPPSPAQEAEMKALKQEVADRKQEIAGFQQEIATLKQEIANLKQEVVSLNSKIGEDTANRAKLASENMELQKKIMEKHQEVVRLRGHLASRDKRLKELEANGAVAPATPNGATPGSRALTPGKRPRDEEIGPSPTTSTPTPGSPTIVASNTSQTPAESVPKRARVNGPGTVAAGAAVIPVAEQEQLPPRPVVAIHPTAPTPGQTPTLVTPTLPSVGDPRQAALVSLSAPPLPTMALDPTAPPFRIDLPVAVVKPEATPPISEGPTEEAPIEQPAEVKVSESTPMDTDEIIDMEEPSAADEEPLQELDASMDVAAESVIEPDATKQVISAEGANNFEEAPQQGEVAIADNVSDSTEVPAPVDSIPVPAAVPVEVHFGLEPLSAAQPASVPSAGAPGLVPAPAAAAPVLLPVTPAAVAASVPVAAAPSPVPPPAQAQAPDVVPPAAPPVAVAIQAHTIAIAAPEVVSPARPPASVPAPTPITPIPAAGATPAATPIPAATPLPVAAPTPAGTPTSAAAPSPAATPTLTLACKSARIC